MGSTGSSLAGNFAATSVSSGKWALLYQLRSSKPTLFINKSDFQLNSKTYQKVLIKKYFGAIFET